MKVLLSFYEDREEEKEEEDDDDDDDDDDDADVREEERACVYDAIQAPKDPLKVLIGSVTRLRAKRFKEAFNGLLQDTCAKVVDFRRILNNEEQAMINLIHVQEGLVGGTKTITQGLGEED
jgi:hypothetical protein